LAPESGEQLNDRIGAETVNSAPIGDRPQPLHCRRSSRKDRGEITLAARQQVLA
jgi:hypothetical protein